MNSKLLFLLSLCFLAGCGVKGDPIVPQDTLLPSVQSKYLTKPEEPKEPKEKKQKEESTKEDE